MALTKIPYSMISGALVNVQDYGADPTGVSDSTAAFTTAAALGRPLWMPQGDYIISSPVTITSGLFGAGAGDTNTPGKTKITLTSAGQLVVGDWYCQWDGFEVRSSVNNKTMIKNDGQSYWTFTNFVIAKISTATGQVGIEFDTTDASIYFNRLDNINIRCDYPVKITGNSTQVFNANKIGIGVGGNKWFDFLSAITVDSTVLACDANEFGGYFESGTNVLTFNGVALRQNRFRLILDVVTRVWNSTVAVTDMNLWEILDGGFTYQGTQPQNQIFIGPASTKVRANDTSSTGSIPNATATIMTFDSEQFDTLSEFAPGTGKFEPKFSGYYQVSASAVTGAYTWPTGTRFEIRVYVNGNLYQSGTYAASETSSAASIKMTSAVNTLLYLTGNSDYLEIKLVSNQGGAIALDNDPRFNFVSIARVE
jgi:hypothetical protein